MNFIQKIVEGKVDEGVHLQFQKFSKGEFPNKALVNVKKSKGKFTINTTAEFANDLVHDVAETLGENKTQVTGAVVSTADLTGELEFMGKKQFQGVKRYLIDAEMSGNEIKGLLDKFPKAFFALSFEIGDTKLKIKPKAPKSAKSKNKDTAPKPDFCKLKTTNAELGGSFVFDTLKGTSKPDFKEAAFNHTFFIDDIIRPEGETDFAKIRELAKRKGRILRKSIIDGIEGEKVIEFEA
jgi:hypothetical protein